MATSTHLDTHIALWLHDSAFEKLSNRQKELIEKSDLHISEFVRLEMQYLHEIGRIRMAPDRIIAYLAAYIELNFSTCPRKILINEAMKLHWTRDPFDRLIVANAQTENAALITCDEFILKNYRRAVG